MAKRLGVKSRDAAAAPLRRSTRSKTPNPNQSISSSHLEPLSTHRSDLRSIQSSSKPKRSNSRKEARVEGKQNCLPNACQNVVEKDTVLGCTSARKRSPRLAKIGTCGMAQDGVCVLKKRDCMVAKIGLEETRPQSVCEIVSDKVAISGLPRSAKVGATNMERRRSSRLVSADTTSNNFNLEITKRSRRSSKSNESSFPHKSDSSGPAVCPPIVQNKVTRNNCMKESSNSCSKGRRKSHKLAVPSDNLDESNCSEGEIGRVSQQCGPSTCENATEKVAMLAPKPPLPPNNRRSKRIGNQSDEITRKGIKSKYVEESDSDYESEESPVRKKRKREESAETEALVQFANGELGGGDGWTEEQEIALHKAYFSARPSPHFWKKVSKMVI